MGEIITGPQVTDHEEKHDGRLDLIIENANKKYNNLFRSVEIGGKPVMSDIYDELEEMGYALTEEMKEGQARCKAMAGFMQEGINALGITPHNTEQYVELTTKQYNDPNSITQIEFDEVCSYIRNIDKLFHFLETKESNGKRFTAEEIAQ